MKTQISMKEGAEASEQKPKICMTNSRRDLQKPFERLETEQQADKYGRFLDLIIDIKYKEGYGGKENPSEIISMAGRQGIYKSRAQRECFPLPMP